ncbi:MAG: 6-pyruvoyl-tetrahydropterin synthase-related protein [Acidimicrobiales bacterium]
MRRPAAPSLVTLCAVGAVIAVVVWSMDPSLLLANTTTTGGDTGAHIALAQYLKTNLLPHLHVTGWDPGAYDGFPLNTFYFPLPDAIAALAGYVIPFNIAFKLVTILGSVTLPVAAWAFGRLAGLERPRPAVLALATLPFLFDQTFTIYGGNLFSTLAGEYAYSLGLSLALVFLGAAIYGMRTGRMRVPAALLLAACVLCHVVTALFAMVGALVVLIVVGLTWRRLWWMVSTVGVGLLLVSWWVVPFAAEQAYSTSMGWLNVHTFATLLAPAADRWALGFAAVGLVFVLVRRDRAGMLLCILGTFSAIAVVFDPQGKLYNTRFLPLWWLCVYLMAGFAVAEAGVLVARLWLALRVRILKAADLASFTPTPLAAAPIAATADKGGHRPPDVGHRQRFAHWAPGAVSVPLVAIVASLGVVVPDLVVSPSSSFSIGPVHVQHSDVNGWAQWNYSGYQRNAGWAELEDGIVATLERVDRRYGCGRAMWEYNSNLNRFGTPEALMDLPMWTDGCIDSMEGLLFESSTTTPYHFLNQAELSTAPSEAMVGLPYGPVDVTLGVQHLQLLGVRYFLASSPSVQDQASADPALSLVATTGPWRTLYQGQTVVTTWKIYLVHDSSMVSPLSHSPVVLVGIGAGQASWLPVAERWYADPALWSTELVAGGPVSWARTRDVPKVSDADHPLPAVRVSRVHVNDDEITFHVDRTGVPVLVRVSYFPAWHATGAAGPWRAEPNLMVVVPSAHDVTLRYGPSGAGRVGELLLVGGLVALVVLIRRRDDVAPMISS